MEEARASVFLERLRATLRSGEYSKQDHLVERLLEEGFSSTDIASALIHQIQNPDGAPEPRPPKLEPQYPREDARRREPPRLKEAAPIRRREAVIDRPQAAVAPKPPAASKPAAPPILAAPPVTLPPVTPPPNRAASGRAAFTRSADARACSDPQTE